MSIIEQPVSVLTRKDPDPLIHYGCCLQIETAICGSPLNGGWTARPVDCLVCQDIHAHTPKGVCPLGRKCPT